MLRNCPGSKLGKGPPSKGFSSNEVISWLSLCLRLTLNSRQPFQSPWGSAKPASWSPTLAWPPAGLRRRRAELIRPARPPRARPSRVKPRLLLLVAVLLVAVLGLAAGAGSSSDPALKARIVPAAMPASSPSSLARITLPVRTKHL
jgi:hypothetical protein